MPTPHKKPNTESEKDSSENDYETDPLERFLWPFAILAIFYFAYGIAAFFWSKP